MLEGLREFDPRMGERLIERAPLSGKQKKSPLRIETEEREVGLKTSFKDAYG